jgi:5-methylthioadenosine/S-adenosylhomocysteine deaminase
MKILIENVSILTMADGDQILKGNVGIVDQDIHFVGDIPQGFNADYTIDGSESLVMPGLVNAHTHASMTLLRSYADDLLFWEWLEGRIMPAEEGLTENDAYIGSKLAIAEMIRSGITTFADMYMFMDKVAVAVEETGIRANLARGLTGQGKVGLEKIEIARKLYDDWHNKAEGRIKVDFAPHAPYTCDAEYIGHILEATKDLDVNIHIHLSESKGEVEQSYKNHGLSPIAYMDQLGLFERKTFAAHCVHLSNEDVQILKEKNVSVINNPGSNCKIANGFAPVKALLEAGVNVALGTDGAASNNNLNIFEEMSLASLVNKAKEEDAVVVPAFKALEMGTINGAKALGLDNEIGTLEVGKKADIIIIDLEKPHFYPRFNLVSSLVYAAQASDVKTVLCNGQILMEDYHLKTLDEKSVFRDADAAAQRLINI